MGYLFVCVLGKYVDEMCNERVNTETTGLITLMIPQAENLDAVGLACDKGALFLNIFGFLHQVAL